MKKIFNWAHRGASGHAPENTLAAFRKAIEMGADGIECDIRESRDGKLVVFHDPTIKRMTGRPERIDQFSCAELKTLDVGSWFSPSFAGETIPTLDEIFENIPPSLFVNLEIKAASPQKVVDRVKNRGIPDRVVLSSFDHPLLRKIRTLDPMLRLGYLIDREPWETVFREALKLNAISLNIPFRRTTAHLAQKAHQCGFKVHVYTVNELNQMASLVEMKIDGLFTDFPDRLSRLQ